MADRPDTLPRWATNDVNDPVTGRPNVEEPPSSKKDVGWEFLEKPPRQWMNWLGRKVYEWLKYLDESRGQPSARVHLDADQSIADDTAEQVDFNVVEFDPHDIFDAGGNFLEVPAGMGGLYLITSEVTFADDGGGGTGHRHVELSLASQTQGVVDVPAVGGNRMGMNTTMIVELEPEDRIFVRVRQTSGGALDVLGDSSGVFTNLEAVRLRP